MRKKARMSLTLWCVLSLVFLCSVLAKADALETWYLVGVDLPASGPVSGSFQFDATTGTVVSADVVTGLGTFVTPIYSESDFLELVQSTASAGNLQNADAFALDLHFHMTGSGGSIPVFSAGIAVCADPVCGQAFYIPDETQAGYLSWPPPASVTTQAPVPEPATLSCVLVCIALGGIRACSISSGKSNRREMQPSRRSPQITTTACTVTARVTPSIRLSVEG